MFLTFLILVTIALAVTAAYFSVVGLAALFSYHYWGTVVLGTSLEAGKIVTTSYLYKFWKSIHFVRRWAMAFIVMLLMVLTSIGIFGYLMQGFQEGSVSKSLSSIKLETNQKELARVESRLKDIETQIANLPSNSVRGRLQLEKAYKDEASVLKTKLFQLTKEQSEIKVSSVEADSHLGPIVYVAKELGIDPAKAATYLVLLIVVIYDPLTVLLTISINHILNERPSGQQNNGVSGVTNNGGKTPRRRFIRRASSVNENKGTPSKTEEAVKEDEKDTGVEPTAPPRKVIAANSGQLIYED